MNKIKKRKENNKENENIDFIIPLLILLSLLIILSWPDERITGYTIYIDDSETNFSLGTFEQTNQTTISGAIILDNSSATEHFDTGNFTSLVIDAGIRSTWQNISWDSINDSNTRLNLSVKSCDDSLCDGEDFIDIEEDVSPQNLSLTNNRYFQYKFVLETDNTAFSPKLYSVNTSYLENQAPATPELNLPLNNSQIEHNILVIELNWSNSTDINNDDLIYYLEIWNESDGENILYVNSSIEETTNTTSDIIIFPNETKNYFWRVLANDGLSNSSFSDLRNISIKKNIPPSTPEINSPLNNTFITDTTPELNWSNSTDPEEENILYYLEVYNDSSLTEITYINSSITETENTTEAIMPELENEDYFWRVLAYDNYENSSFSDTRLFTIDTIAPTSFNLTSPANETSSTDNTPSLAWEATNEANLENYTIEFSTSNTYQNPNYTQKSLTNSFSNWTTELPANTYYWKVIAYDKVSQSNESEEQRTLIISAISDTVTETISAGEATSRSGGVKKKPFNLDIIAPPSVTVYSNDRVIVPLIITNPANEIVLKKINLNATGDSSDVATFLATTFIPELRPKEQVTVPLTIETHTEPGAYGITVTASIINPKFTDSVKIYANLIEKDTTSESKSSKQIAFAKEMFNGNSVCLELNEYIKQAELALKEEKYDKALNLADSAIQSCKDLIAFKIQPQTPTVETYLKRTKLDKNTLIIILESLSFLTVLLVIFKLIKRKKNE